MFVPVRHEWTLAVEQSDESRRKDRRKLLPVLLKVPLPVKLRTRYGGIFAGGGYVMTPQTIAPNKSDPCTSGYFATTLRSYEALKPAGAA